MFEIKTIGLFMVFKDVRIKFCVRGTSCSTSTKNEAVRHFSIKVGSDNRSSFICLKICFLLKWYSLMSKCCKTCTHEQRMLATKKPQLHLDMNTTCMSSRCVCVLAPAVTGTVLTGELNATFHT